MTCSHRVCNIAVGQQLPFQYGAVSPLQTQPGVLDCVGHSDLTAQETMSNDYTLANACRKVRAGRLAVHYNERTRQMTPMHACWVACSQACYRYLRQQAQMMELETKHLFILRGLPRAKWDEGRRGLLSSQRSLADSSRLRQATTRAFSDLSSSSREATVDANSNEGYMSDD